VNALFCTIATRNRLAHARTLAASLRRFHPGTRLVVLLVDPAADRPAFDGLEILPLSVLRIPHVERLLFRYTAKEFCGMLKPWLLAHLLERRRPTALVYFDATGFILGPMTSVLRRLGRHPILLTPHLISPLPDDGRQKDDRDILLSGPFNSGFVGVASDRQARAFLRWWAVRTRAHSHSDPGLSSNDQKWLALVPGLFPGTVILREPGCNLAYWNLPNRRLSGRGHAWRVDGRPAMFAFLSGFEPERPNAISGYDGRDLFRRRPDVRRLVRSYHGSLLRYGYATARTQPYLFDFHDNGVPIPNAARRLYRELGRRTARFGNPFQTSGRSFFTWLRQPADRGQPAIPRLWGWLYLNSPILRRAIPEGLRKRRRSYLAWIRGQGARELGVDPAFLP